MFEPFSILGLEPGVSDSEIKKAYRRLSILYHPDKNPDPGGRCLMSAIYIYSSFQNWVGIWLIFLLNETFLRRGPQVFYWFYLQGLSGSNRSCSTWKLWKIWPSWWQAGSFLWGKVFAPHYQVFLRKQTYVLLILVVGPTNGDCSPPVPSEHWWSLWWNFATWNCRSLYYFSTDNSRYILVKVFEIHWKLCHASYDVCVLPFYEAFVGSKVLNHLSLSNLCIYYYMFKLHNAMK